MTGRVRPLTGAQARAIDHPARQLQILASAGSGKTEVLARRAVRLFVEGIDPAAVIAFTFTEKAAGELKARIEARAAEADARFRELPPAGRGMFIGTTHGWALRALQELGGAYETADGLTEEQEWVLLHRVARRLGFIDLYAALEGKPTNRVAAAPAIEVFLRSVEAVYNERIDRATLRARAPAFAAVLERYEWLLGQMRLLPFRSMISRAVDELAPGGGLRRRLEGRIVHVLVDEFQDFNPAQDLLLRRLVETGAAVTVVGDDDQAIYQWRGGDVSLFNSFHDRHPGTERLPLAENHRSRPEIVRFARQLVEPLAGRLDKVLESAREPAPAGALEVLVAETADDEASGIAGRIARLIAQGHRAGDIAVLYRSVRTSAAPLVRELRSRGIPVAVVGKTSLLAHPEMALLARILVLWAGGTWYPNQDFQPEVVTRQSLIDEIRSVTRASQPDAERAMALLDDLGGRVRREGVRDSVALFNEILAVLGLPGDGDQGASRELGLGQMSALLADFDHAARRAAPAELYERPPAEHAGEAAEDMAIGGEHADRAATVLGATRGEIYLTRLRAFLEEFAGRAAEETPASATEARDAVQIMTVHQAKGLEFPIVFVPALVEGRFPGRLVGRQEQWYVPPDLFDRTRYEGREDDEARLLYVALTRARELLVTSWFRRHRARGARPSRFLTQHLRGALRDPVLLSLGQAAPPPAPAVVTAEPLDLDFSSLITYQECAYRYRLRYVCGFRPPLAPELGFGKLLHHLIAELARLAASGTRPAGADVDSILAGSFYLPLAGPVPAARLREALRARTTAYLRDFGEELSRTIQPEVRFEVPLSTARVRGRIDLLLRAASGTLRQVELIDFKTSANRPPSDVHVNQLRLYAASMERLGLEPVRLAVHDLDADHGGRIDVASDAGARQAFAERLEHWVEGIRGGRFPPPEDRKVCRACDFCRFCRYAPPEPRRTGRRGRAAAEGG